MKVLLSVVVAALAFGAFVAAGPQRERGGQGERMPPPPSGGGNLMKHAKMLKMLACLCEGNTSNCTVMDQFFDCIKDDMMYLGDITDMSMCDVKMKLEERTDGCFGEGGSMMEPLMMCKEELRAQKMEMMGDMGMRDDMGGDMMGRMDPCMKSGGTEEES